MADRTTLLETRVARLTQLLAELTEAWAYVHSSTPEDASRLGPLSGEIELTEIELKAAIHALKLHSTPIVKNPSRHG
jgi:hypothetical protein